MPDLKRIVVPVDLQKHTDKLIEFAVDIANKLDCELLLFHGVEYTELEDLANTSEAALVNFSTDDYLSARLTRARQQLDRLTGEVAGRCKACHSKVSVGDIVDDIIDYAKAEKADLIIIGTHGKRGLEKILLGSIAERVIKRAHCPTLVMNPYR